MSMRLQGSISCMLTICSPTVSVLSTLRMSSLKKKLQKEGLFSNITKSRCRRTPKKVGVITSPTGAAVRDIINVLGRRFPYAEIVFCPVLVQGDGAHLQLTDAVNMFNSERAADVIIIGRGGGSIEDLWEFNDEGLARAVYNSEIPVISAVGHETDFTICDFVADMRAPHAVGSSGIGGSGCERITVRFVGFKEPNVFKCFLRNCRQTLEARISYV